MMTMLVSVDRYLAFWVMSVCRDVTEREKSKEEGKTRIPWGGGGELIYFIYLFFLIIGSHVSSFEAWFYLPCQENTD